MIVKLVVVVDSLLCDSSTCQHVVACNAVMSCNRLCKRWLQLYACHSHSSCRMRGGNMVFWSSVRSDFVASVWHVVNDGVVPITDSVRFVCREVKPLAMSAVVRHGVLVLKCNPSYIRQW